MHSEYSWSNDGSGSESSEYIYPKLKRILDEYKECVILDIGCGNGLIANRLMSEGYEVYGLDSSESGIEYANKINPGHFFVADLEEGIVPEIILDKKVNVIISTEVIEHIYSPRLYMNYCNKIFENRHGIIIISTPYHGYLKNLMLAISGKMDNHFTALWEGGHIKFWSKNTLKELLDKHGFRFVKFVGCGRIAWLWKSMIVVGEKQ